jgi:GT2 family glycosyltransferase
VKRAGYTVHLDPTARVIHHEGAGSGHRTRRVRRRHIVAFHRAALQWFCLHHGIGRANPIRLIAGAALSCRAGLLIAADALKPDVPPAGQLHAGRPEGGVAL